MSTTSEGGKNKRLLTRMKSILQVAAFILLLLVLPIISAFGVAYYSLLDISGRFKPWQSLGGPPERALRIIGLCYASVCVETENNAKYFHCLNNKNCWTKTDLPDEDIIPFSAKLYNPCQFEFEVPSPPADTIQIAGAKACESGGDGQTYYALQEDGTVWVWSHTIPDMASLAALGALWLGLQIGIVIDAILVILVLAIRDRRPPSKSVIINN